MARWLAVYRDRQWKIDWSQCMRVRTRIFEDSRNRRIEMNRENRSTMAQPRERGRSKRLFEESEKKRTKKKLVGQREKEAMQVLLRVESRDQSPSRKKSIKETEEDEYRGKSNLHRCIDET